MILTDLNRPNNFLINRLGLGSSWKTTPTYFFSKKIYNFLNQTYLSKYFQILFKSGVIYTNHVFFNNLFFFKKIFTMPLVSSEEQLFKFFRLVRLKYSMRFRAKRNYLMRKYVKFLNISELFFLRINNLILVMIFISIPEPLKRFNYLKTRPNKEVIVFKNQNLIIKKITSFDFFFYKTLNLF